MAVMDVLPSATPSTVIVLPVTETRAMRSKRAVAA